MPCMSLTVFVGHGYNRNTSGGHRDICRCWRSEVTASIGLEDRVSVPDLFSSCVERIPAFLLSLARFVFLMHCWMMPAFHIFTFVSFLLLLS